MPKRRMTAARILQIKRFQYAGVKARVRAPRNKYSPTRLPPGAAGTSGPGSLKWANSSILLRSGTAQAKKSRIVHIYQPSGDFNTMFVKANNSRNAYAQWIGKRVR